MSTRVFSFSPPQKLPRFEEQEDEIVSICLAKFPLRPKATFGSLIVGQSRSISVEICLPPDYNGLDRDLNCTLSSKSDGLSISRGSEPLGLRETVCIPAGSDSTKIKITLRPEAEDSVCGSLDLECKAAGTLLKGAIAFTGKVLPKPKKTITKGTPSRVPGIESPSGAPRADRKRTAAKLTAQSPPLPPPRPRPSQVTIPLIPAQKLSLKPLTSVPVLSRKTDTQKPSDQSFKGKAVLGSNKRPAALTPLRAPAPKQQAMAPSAEDISTGADRILSGQPEDISTGADQILSGHPEDINEAPGHQEAEVMQMMTSRPQLPLRAKAAANEPPSPFQLRKVDSETELTSKQSPVDEEGKEGGAATRKRWEQSCHRVMPTPRTLLASGVAPSTRPPLKGFQKLVTVTSRPEALIQRENRSTLEKRSSSARRPHPDNIIKSGGVNFLRLHSEIPAAKQERALVSWLNSHLTTSSLTGASSASGSADSLIKPLLTPGTSCTGAHEASNKSSPPLVVKNAGHMSGRHSPSAAPGKKSPKAPQEAPSVVSPASNAILLTGPVVSTEPLLLKRLSAQVRGVLWRQYRDNKEIFEIISKVFGKIDGGFFNMTEAPLTADFSEVSKLVDPLLSYHPFWLKSALLLIFRDNVKNINSGDDSKVSEDRVWKRSVQSLVRETLLSEKLMQGASDKTAFWRSSSDHLLKNLLLSVLLLDKTLSNPQANRMPRGVPPLFCPSSMYKSSKEVVRAFLTGRMRGVGDVIHQLESWGYRVEYSQSPADDFDYTVTSLKEDLRSGIRLAKLYEVLTGSAPLLGKESHCEPPLFLNPVTDQQRMGNMTTVLLRMHEAGALPGEGQRILTRAGLFPLRAREIVDANRDMTLGMLMHIANKWQMPQLLSIKELATEVKRLQRQSLRVQASSSAPSGRRVTTEDLKQQLDVYPGNARLNLLLKWAQAVGALHGLRVNDFKSSFGDGRVLCYMICSYVPSILSKDEIYQPDAPKPEDVAVLLEGDEDIDLETLRRKGWCAVYEAGGSMDDDGLLKSFSNGIRHNFSMVHQAARRIGRVPEMLSPDDFADGLDEQSVVLYVAHLCARLLEISKEERAACIITQAMRKLMWIRKYGPELELTRNRSATTIQSHWRRCRAQRLASDMRVLRDQEVADKLEKLREASAILIQACWRGHVARQQFGMIARILACGLRRRAALVAQWKFRCREAAAIIIQNAWKCWRVRSDFLLKRSLVCKIQAQVKMLQARARYLTMRGAAVLIQRKFRIFLVTGSTKRRDSAALVIQKHWKGRKEMARFVSFRKSVCKIQAVVRGHLQRRELQRQLSSTIQIQTAWRKYQCRQKFLNVKAAAIVVQSLCRGWIARRNFSDIRLKASLIQAAWRGCSVRRTLALKVNSVIRIQSAWRGYKARHALFVAASAAALIQAAWRGHAARVLLQKHHMSARSIQAAWRSYSARTSFLKKRATAIILQAQWRRHVVQAHVKHLHACAIHIQACWRAFHACLHFRRKKYAVILIQKNARMWIERREFLKFRQSVIMIQAYWRGATVRVRVTGLKQKREDRRNAAATYIQALWRGSCQRLVYRRQLKHIITVQAAVRGVITRTILKEKKRAVLALEGLWLRRAAMLYKKRAVNAALIIQSHWRRHAAEKAMVSLRHAALTFQAAYRSHAGCMKFAQMRTAAGVIQRFARGMIARRHVAVQKAMESAVKEFQTTMAVYAKRLAAARSIQSAWRGYVVRRHTSPVLASAKLNRIKNQAAAVILKYYRCHLERRRQADIRSATDTITRLIPIIQARRQLRALKRAHERRCKAAMTIQSIFRMVRLKRKYELILRGVTRFQALWRGYSVRNSSGCSVVAARHKLHTASLAAQKEPHKHIGVRMREALGVLLAKRETEKVCVPMLRVEEFTSVSRDCCKVVAEDSGIVKELLQHMRRCNRSKPHEGVLKSLLGILNNMCRYTDLLPSVFRAGDCMDILSEKLQMFRDTEEVFMPTVIVLQRLLSLEEHAVNIAQRPETFRTWEGIAQVLSRKMESERKYIERLEVRKGSDNAAKQSTNKVVSAAKALHSLQDLIAVVIKAASKHGISLHDGRPVPGSHITSGKEQSSASNVKHSNQEAFLALPTEFIEPAAWQAKNTLVRNALKEIKNKYVQQVASERASASAVEEAAGCDPAGVAALALASCNVDLVVKSNTSHASSHQARAGTVRSPDRSSPHGRPAKTRRVWEPHSARKL
ncbi:hypothetical protein CEUSTIGMA_g1623.t1 [Chlamydomonas eustigma]|uniref:Calponin-homology (CH) domain-containing protein n=1 Tax=Chlamydomonas eustigma TaxID=1157962 RepID=A0A250WTL5_9CHLO|nr:hypothetical protein CEUSTIGMA_g1623.t1 [Chlamydomonas eustigma]|eukprot:GAX74174.1 hypothetical protein CEUSTIGMA_g1623.t1 [Chlamydomonas eustigma]